MEGTIIDLYDTGDKLDYLIELKERDENLYLLMGKVNGNLEDKNEIHILDIKRLELKEIVKCNIKTNCFSINETGNIVCLCNTIKSAADVFEIFIKEDNAWEQWSESDAVDGSLYSRGFSVEGSLFVDKDTVILWSENGEMVKMNTVSNSVTMLEKNKDYEISKLVDIHKTNNKNIICGLTADGLLITWDINTGQIKQCEKVLDVDINDQIEYFFRSDDIYTSVSFNRVSQFRYDDKTDIFYKEYQFKIEESEITDRKWESIVGLVPSKDGTCKELLVLGEKGLCNYKVGYGVKKVSGDDEFRNGEEYNLISKGTWIDPSRYTKNGKYMFACDGDGLLHKLEGKYFRKPLVQRKGNNLNKSYDIEL